MRSRSWLVMAAMAALAVGQGPAMSQTASWPDRPLTMVVPLAAGSGIDVLARVLAPRLSEILGQTVIVENVTGAGGTTGAARSREPHRTDFSSCSAAQARMPMLRRSMRIRHTTH